MPLASPPTPPPSSRPGPRRRALLLGTAGAAGAGALAAGCTNGTEDGDVQSTAAERARVRAARESGELVARYDAVLAAHPALGPRLKPLRAEVARHAEAFGGAHGDRSAPAPDGSPRATDGGDVRRAAGAPDGDGTPGTPRVPARASEALTMLAAAERALADRRMTALPNLPGELARLMASVAAAGAAHVYLLTKGDR